MSIYISDLLPKEFLERYEGKQPKWGFGGLGYIVYKRCVDIDTLVLCDDLTWGKAGELKEGDGIIGFDSERSRKINGSLQGFRYIRHGMVTHNNIEDARCMGVELEDGTILYSTPDHRWLARFEGNTTIHWRETKNLNQTKYGNPVFLLRPFGKPWELDRSYEAGFLSGAYDGEGCLDRLNGFSFTQVQNPMLEAVEKFMDYKGIKYSRSAKSLNTPIEYSKSGKACYTLRTHGIKNIFRFLGKIRPPRLLQKFLEGFKKGSGGLQMRCNPGDYVRVKRVFDAGVRKVAVLSTDIETHFTGGFASHNTYSRLKEDGKSEEWWETVARGINGAQKIGAGYTKEEAQTLYDHIFHLRCSFAGRMLWQLNTPTVERFGGASLLNCFGGETEVITDRGVKSILDLVSDSKNKLVEPYKVLTSRGGFEKAEFKSFGKQKLSTILLSKGRSKKTIRATANHRWFRRPYRHGAERNSFKKIEVLTRGLKRGDKLVSVHGQSIKDIGFISPIGMMHGVLFGDGSVSCNVGQIRLCGKKNRELLPLFEGFKQNDYEGDVIVSGLPKYFKDKPDLTLDKGYLYGFLAGYFAADGCISESGQIKIASSRKENLNLVKSVCAKLGIFYSLITEQDREGIDGRMSTLYFININGFSLTSDFFLTSSHLKRFENHSYRRPDDWKVVGVVEGCEEAEKEEVYCAVVGSTGDFTLDNHILTGNCFFVSMTDSEDFCFLFEHLMLGGGVGFSVRREDVHELPRIKQDVKVWNDINDKNLPTKDADFIVPDSREGWVSLLRHVVDAFFRTGKSFSYSVILVRGAGELIQGFGGVASGPKILVEGVQKIVKIFQSRSNLKLRSIDVLDICNIIGSIVVSGNVRRCLPRDSKVHLKRGLVSIQETKVGDEVLTSRGYKKVQNIFNQGKQKTIVIKTQDGKFECTPNHKMAVLNSVEGYDWIQAKNLRRGQRLVSSRIPVEGVMQSLPSWSYKKPERSTTCQDITIPVLDEGVAWLMGAFHGKGYVFANRRKNGFNAYLSIAFSSEEQVFAEKAKKQLEKFGVKNVTSSKRKGENRWIVKCQSKQLAWYFDQFVKKPKMEIRVPEWINQASDNIKLSYVCGVMDSGGSVKNRPAKNRPAKNRPANIVTTIHKCFAEDLQNLLYSCGIESRFKDCGKPPSGKESWGRLYMVNLITAHAKNKISKSGFSLKTILPFSKCQNSNSYPSEFIKEQKSKVNVYSKKNITVENYEKCFGTTLEYIPVKIIATKEGCIVETYDIEVEGAHEFFCNGYLTHNSAELAIGDPDDINYINAKRWDKGNIPNERDMSNNSLYIDKYEDILPQVWEGYVGNGEGYGFINIPLTQRFGRMKDGPMYKSELYPTRYDNAQGFNPCGEIGLADGEACNLCELYLNNIETKEQLIECAKLLYKTQKAVWTLPFFYEKTQKIAVKNRRIGLGVTGVCQSLDKIEWLDDCYLALRAFDKEWSEKRGWKQSIKLTTVKPSGTLSLLAGATPGVHPAYARHYIRRVRLSFNDNLVDVCKGLGYDTEFAMNLDGTVRHDTVIVSFPIKVDEETIIAEDMTAISQLELVKKMQSEWSDNSVSVSVYYKKEEIKEIQEWLEENYEGSLKSVSFLLHSDHGFMQAPYEKISEEKYNELMKSVKPMLSVEGDTTGDLIQGIECEGGACPVR